MSAPKWELEGTWEEIAVHADELRGHRVRLTVVSGPEAFADEDGVVIPEGGGTATSILKHAGTWEGNDLQECLDFVVRSRSQARF